MVPFLSVPLFSLQTVGFGGTSYKLIYHLLEAITHFQRNFQAKTSACQIYHFEDDHQFQLSAAKRQSMTFTSKHFKLLNAAIHLITYGHYLCVIFYGNFSIHSYSWALPTPWDLPALWVIQGLLRVFLDNISNI